MIRKALFGMGILMVLGILININIASAIWWDSDWNNCKNITQYNNTITGSADWIPIQTTITGLTCDNCTKEIRIVNKGCNDGGDVVDSFVYSERGSSPNKEVDIEYLANYTGDNSTYSIYYDNSLASDNYLGLIKGYEVNNFATVEYNGYNITKLTKTNFEAYPCGNTGIDSNCNSLNYIRLPNGNWISESFGSARGLGQFLDYNNHYIAPRANTSLHGIDCGNGGTLCNYKVFTDSDSTEMGFYTWDWKFYYRGDNSILIWLNATQNVTNSYTSGTGTGSIEYPSIPFKIAPFTSNSITNGYWFYADGEDTEDSGDFETTHGATALGDNFHGTYNSSFVAGVINRSGSIYHYVGENLATAQDSNTFKDGQSVSTGLKYQTLYYFFNDSGSWENIKDMGNILDNIFTSIGNEELYEAPTTTTSTTVPITTTIPQCTYLSCEEQVDGCMCGSFFITYPLYCCGATSEAEVLQETCFSDCGVTTLSTTTEPCSEIDMYLHYKFDNTTGDFIYDYSNNERFGTTYNSPDWVDGKIDNGLQFNGYNQYFVVENDDHLKFERTEPFSFSVWVKTNGTEGGFDILTNYNDYVSLTGFSFGALYGQIGFTLRNNIYENNYLSVLTDDTNIYDDNFHHVVVTYDGNSSIDGIKIYVDNELKHIGTEHNTLSDTTVNTNPLTSGIAEGSATYGIIDDLRVYNKVLKVRDVNYLYNYGNGTEGVLGGCIIIPDVMVQKSCINGNTQLLTNTTYFDGDNFYSTLNSTWCEYGCSETFFGTRCNFQPSVNIGIAIVLLVLIIFLIVTFKKLMGGLL